MADNWLQEFRSRVRQDVEAELQRRQPEFVAQLRGQVEQEVRGEFDQKLKELAAACPAVVAPDRSVTTSATTSERQTEGPRLQESTPAEAAPLMSDPKAARRRQEVDQLRALLARRFGLDEAADECVHLYPAGLRTCLNQALFNDRCETELGCLQCLTRPLVVKGNLVAAARTRDINADYELFVKSLAPQDRVKLEDAGFAARVKHQLRVWLEESTWREVQDFSYLGAQNSEDDLVNPHNSNGRPQLEHMERDAVRGFEIAPSKGDQVNVLFAPDSALILEHEWKLIQPQDDNTCVLGGLGRKRFEMFWTHRDRFVPMRPKARRHMPDQELAECAAQTDSPRACVAQAETCEEAKALPCVTCRNKPIYFRWTPVTDNCQRLTDAQRPTVAAMAEKVLTQQLEHAKLAWLGVAGAADSLAVLLPHLTEEETRTLRANILTRQQVLAQREQRRLLQRKVSPEELDQKDPLLFQRLFDTKLTHEEREQYNAATAVPPAETVRLALDALEARWRASPEFAHQFGARFDAKETLGRIASEITNWYNERRGRELFDYFDREVVESQEFQWLRGVEATGALRQQLRVRDWKNLQILEDKCVVDIDTGRYILLAQIWRKDHSRHEDLAPDSRCPNLLKSLAECISQRDGLDECRVPPTSACLANARCLA